MKKHEQFLSISQLPPELTRAEMTTFLYELPQLPTPSPATGIWSSWHNWLFIAVCSAGLLVTVAKILPGDSPSVAKVENPAPPAKAEVIQAPPQDLPIQEDSVETVALPAPAELSSAPFKEEIAITPQAADQDSLFPPATEEGLFEPSKLATDQRLIRQHPVLSYKQREGLVVPTDTGKLTGLFGDYTPDPNAGQFDGVPMKRLRRKLRREYLRDGLITSKTERADLSLPDGAAFLNDEELMPDLSLKYKKIARSFGIGTGPDRFIKTTDKGIAVGDFRENGFFGRAFGVFKLEMPD